MSLGHSPVARPAAMPLACYQCDKYQFKYDHDFPVVHTTWHAAQAELHS